MAWKDLSPRVGVAFDLFGTGKTALKASFARYVAPLATETQVANNPQNTIGATDTRNWSDLNRDYTIYNPDGSVQCGRARADEQRQLRQADPDDRDARSEDAQRLELPRRHLGVADRRAARAVADDGRSTAAITTATSTIRRPSTTRSSPTPTTTDRSASPRPTTPTSPAAAAIRSAGSTTSSPTARGLVQNHTTLARNFGGVTDEFQGFDLGANARFAGDTYLNVGINMQKRLLDTCNTDGIDSPEAQFCRTMTPYRPDFKFSGSRSLFWELQVSATYQLSPGPRVTATWNVPGAIIAADLGRTLSAGATATKSVQLIEPETIYTDYLKQLDLRLSRRFSVGRMRMRANASLYNVFNNDFVNSVNTTFSTTASNAFMRPDRSAAGTPVQDRRTAGFLRSRRT